MENNDGGLRGRLKSWHLSEGLKCEADVAKGRLEEGALGSGRALQQPGGRRELRGEGSGG